MADRQIGNVKIGFNDNYYAKLKDDLRGTANSFITELAFDRVGVIYADGYREIQEVKEDIITKLDTFPNVGVVADSSTRLSNQGDAGIIIYHDNAGTWEIYNDISDISSSALQQGIDPSQITSVLIDFSRVNSTYTFGSPSVVRFSVKFTEIFKIPNVFVNGLYRGISGLVFFNTDGTGKHVPLVFLNIYPFNDENDGLTINGKINLMD